MNYNNHLDTKFHILLRKLISPDVLVSKLPIMFNRVDFPHPEGPIIAQISLSSDIKFIGPRTFFLSFWYLRF